MEDHTRQLIDLILDSFSEEFRVAIGIFEKTANKGIFSQKAKNYFSPLCQYMNSHSDLKSICDADHMKRGSELIMKPEIRYCICGLVNISMPIVVQGECHGMILCGQKRLDDESTEQISKNNLDYFLATNKKIRKYRENIAKKYDEVDKIDKEYFNNLTSKLEQSTCKLVFTVYLERKLIEQDKKDLEKRIDNVAHEIQIYNQGALAATERLQYELSGNQVTEIGRQVLLKLPGMLTHLGSVVTNLLWLSSTNYSKYEKFEKIDLLPILKNAISYYEWYASGRDITIELDKITCSTHAVCSGFLMEQVFNNLLHNAIKYSFAGLRGFGRFRYVSVKVYSEKNCYCCVSFANYGVGITEDERTKIQEVFYRGSKVIDERRTGTGIGLSIVQAIAKIHKGDVQVESIPTASKAHLNTFTIRIPYYSEDLS